MTVNMTAMLPPPNDIVFRADAVKISSDRLCLGFDDEIVDFEKIDRLIFEVNGRKFSYKKEIGDEETV